MLADTLRHLKLEELSTKERNALVKALRQHRRKLEAAIKVIDKSLEGVPIARRSKKGAK